MVDRSQTLLASTKKDKGSSLKRIFFISQFTVFNGRNLENYIKNNNGRVVIDLDDYDDKEVKSVLMFKFYK